MFKTIDNNDDKGIFNIYKVVKENKILLKPISLHDMILNQYALILSHYPMKESKFNIFIQLDKHKRVGMLNRHILSVASKLGVYQVILKEIIKLRIDHNKYKKFINDSEEHKEYWIKAFEKNQNELTTRYHMLLDIIGEEISKRNNPKYLRKKKLQEIKDNLQDSFHN